MFSAQKRFRVEFVKGLPPANAVLRSTSRIFRDKGLFTFTPLNWLPLFAIYSHSSVPRSRSPPISAACSFENGARAKCCAVANWISVTLLLGNPSVPSPPPFHRPRELHRQCTAVAFGGFAAAHRYRCSMHFQGFCAARGTCA